MSNTVKVVLWGAFGLFVAALLSLSAFAIAGDSIGEPADPIPVPSVTRTPDDASETPEPTRTSEDEPTHTSSPTGTSSSSEPGDRHGGDDSSGHGSDDGGGDDSSGHGSDDD